MEYQYWTTYLAQYLPISGELSDNTDFVSYLTTQGESIGWQLTDFMMMTLPSPRVSYYESQDYFTIQKGVTGYSNQIIEDLGFFPLRMEMDVLSNMQLFSTAILFLGLIFDIIVLLFVILSVLLIYSLLMISVETKTFEFGVMRMVGLSKSGIITMILIQSVMFVVPSLIGGFVLVFPTLLYLYSILFTKDMGVDTTPVPSSFAVI